MSELVCVLIAFGVSIVIGAICMATNLFGIGQLLFNIGFPKFLVIIFELGCIVLAFILTYDAVYRYAKGDYYDVYYTTKVELNRYAEIDDSPHGKEIGKVPVDTVLNVRHFTAKDSITWLESYMLTPKGTPEKLFVIVPQKIDRGDVRKSNEYYDYHDTSRSFGAYYEKIDKENEQIKEMIRAEFKAGLIKEGIVVSHSSDSILKESLKDTSFIFPNEGYLELYQSGESDFYYIPKEDKKRFLKLVDSYVQKMNEEIKQYF
ncbi:MAG: hypothetical protein SO369_10510 [Treponema sp.]|nr:hypothetical protein [Treponema sp.]